MSKYNRYKHPDYLEATRIFMEARYGLRFRASGEGYWCLCPLHKEDTPSFVLNVRDGLVKMHCFGQCGSDFDIYNILQKRDGLSLDRAYEIVADAFPKIDVKSPPREGTSTKPGNVSIFKMAADVYHRYLKENKGLKLVADFLRARGVTDEMIEKYHLGFVPGSMYGEPFTDECVRVGCVDEAKALKLIWSRGAKLRDYFGGRITIPLYSTEWDIIGFTARALGRAQNKYMNTVGMECGNNLYGLNWAISSIRETGEAWLVEGPFDYMAVADRIPNAVATFGASLKPGQRDTLLSMDIKSMVVMYDGDSAGRKGANRTFASMSGTGIHMKIIDMPGGQDPASYKGDVKALPERAAESEAPNPYDKVWVDKHAIIEATRYQSAQNQFLMKERIEALATLIESGRPDWKKLHVRLPRSLGQTVRGMGSEAFLYVWLLMKQQLDRDAYISTHSKIANELGTTRKTIQMAMLKLVDRGLLRYEKQQFRNIYKTYIVKQ